MRLIDADELKKLFPDYGEGSCTYNRTARMYIDNAPTVELFCSYLSDGEVRQPCVEVPCKDERPTGEWKLDDTEQFCYCSNCEDTFYPRPLDPSWDYCPHCGAKMKGAEE